jgi:hypothetical protein
VAKFHSPSTSLVGEAFEAAKAKFASDLTKDGRKIAYISSATGLEDVRNAVSKSMEKYSPDGTRSKARKWLERLSQRIHHYSTIFDVLVQHHPEYVLSRMISYIVTAKLRTDMSP